MIADDVGHRPPKQRQATINRGFAMPKATRKIVMTVFCLEEDAEDAKASLLSEAGECWFYDQDFSLGNIKIEILEPTDDEERAAREVLDVRDDEEMEPDTEQQC
jgi:hypothetical protein